MGPPLGSITPPAAAPADGPDGPTRPGWSRLGAPDGASAPLGDEDGRTAADGLIADASAVGEAWVGAPVVGAGPAGLPVAGDDTLTDTVPAPPVPSRHDGTRDTDADALNATLTW